MTSIQEHINQKYLDKKIKVLELKNQDLEGHLDLSEFTELEELNCSRNCLDSLDLGRCANLVKLDCSYNTFNDLEFLTKLPDPEKLISLNLKECGVPFSPEKITQILLPFVNLQGREEIINAGKSVVLLEKQELEEKEAKIKSLEVQLADYQQQIAKLQNKLEVEKITRQALDKFQKELTNVLIEKALLEERIKVAKEKIAELRKNREELAMRQLQKLENELANWKEQLKINEKNEQDLESKIELLRQGPKVLEGEVENKIDEVKQKLRAKNKKELQLLENIAENCKQLLDLRIDEKRILSIREKLKNLKNEFFSVRGLKTSEAKEVRELVEEVVKKGDKLVDLREILCEVDKIEDKEIKEKKKLIKLQRQDSNKIRKEFGKYETCSECQQLNTGIDYCRICKSKIFKENFSNWTSGNQKIDQLVQKSQLEAKNKYGVLEWIPYEQFTNFSDKPIGKGGFGEVNQAEWQNKKVALKSLNSQNTTTDFLQEIIHHKQLGEQLHIVECYGISQNPQTKNYLIVMEYMEGGNLKQFLSNKSNKVSVSNWENKLFQLKTIAQGLKSIHEQGLIHRDFHPGNILFDRHGDTAWCKITDLGLCREISQANNEKKSYGVRSYVAPEVLQGQSYTQASDIYSFGIISYEILSELSPYYDKKHDEFLGMQICQGLRPKFKIKVPPLLKDLIKKCWDSNSENRPTASEIENKLLLYWNEIKGNRSTEFIQQIREAEEFNQTLKLEKEVKQIEEIVDLTIENELKELIKDFIKTNQKALNEKNEEAEKELEELENRLKKELTKMSLSEKEINRVVRCCEKVIIWEQPKEEFQTRIEAAPR